MSLNRLSNFLKSTAPLLSPYTCLSALPRQPRSCRPLLFGPLPWITTVPFPFAFGPFSALSYAFCALGDSALRILVFGFVSSSPAFDQSIVLIPYSYCSANLSGGSLNASLNFPFAFCSGGTASYSKPDSLLPAVAASSI